MSLSNEKTPWFDYRLHKPKRAGLYECSCGALHLYEKGNWHIVISNRQLLKKEVIHRIPITDLYGSKWRGLSGPAK